MLGLYQCTKKSTVTSSFDLRLRGQRSKKVKFQTSSNSNSGYIIVLFLDKHAKVSTVTSSSDLRLRGQRSRKVKFQTSSYTNSGYANVFFLDKHVKVFTVTSLYDLQLRGHRSSKVKFQKSSKSDSGNVIVFLLDKHAKVSTVTSSCDIRLRGQSKKRSSLKHQQTVFYIQTHNYVVPLERAQFSSFFFFLCDNLLLLPHTSMDFNQTWSQASMGAWLQKT